MAVFQTLLHWVARVFRVLPYVPGKVRVAKMLNNVLIHWGEGLVRFRTNRGLCMRIDLRSKVEWKTYWTGRYDDDEIRALLELIGRKGTILDVGAQVGFYTVAFSEALEEGEVHAFEPIEQNFRRLTENVEKNNLKNVNLHETALGNKQSTSTFRVEKKGFATTGNAFEVKKGVKEIDQKQEQVEVRKLDSIEDKLSIGRCSLIKVDIEGGEVGFLRGARKFIQRERPYIYGEFSAFWLKMYDQSFEDVLKMCKDWGYIICKIRKGFFEEVEFPNDSTQNILLVPKEKKDVVLSLKW